MSKAIKSLLMLVLFVGLLFGLKVFYDNAKGPGGLMDQANNDTITVTSEEVKIKTYVSSGTSTVSNTSNTSNASNTEKASSSSESLKIESEKTTETKNVESKKQEDSNKPKVIEGPDGKKRYLLPPHLSVTDSEGNRVKLGELTGKKMIVNIWASWCGPCKAEMPGLISLEKELKDDEMILMINSGGMFGETKEKAMAFLKDNDLNFKNMYFDEDGSVSMALGADAIPASLFVDSEGYIVVGVKGAMSDQKFREYLDRVD